MRISRAGIRQCTLYLFFALTAIGAMVIAGTARADVCVQGKNFTFNGTEKLKVTALGFSETYSDPLIATVKTRTTNGKIKWKYWDEENNFRKGKIVRAGSDRQFQVFLSAASRQDWEDTIEVWVEEIVGGNASGRLTSYAITGKCNVALTRVKVKIKATFEGSAGGETGTANYVGKMMADLE